jgi:3'-5' exoribonuclease
MKKVFLKDINPEDEVVDFFLVRSKNIAVTKNGKRYLDLELQDSSGVAGAKMWDGVDRVEKLFERGDIIKIKAVAQKYRDDLQIRIDDIRTPTAKEQLDLEDFIPSTPKDPVKMTENIVELIESVKEKNLASLLRSFWEDDDFRRAFVRSPAARNIHHAYLGGLLEHTLNVALLADKCSQLYPELNRDLLLTMAILHDIGKIKELEATGEIVYTRDGLLEGHISIGLEMLNQRFALIPDFPAELALRCKHILLSHHGELEFGSPIVPKTPEAITLHFLDNLDAKTNIFVRAIDKDKNKAEEFTTFNKVMNRNIYKGPKESGEGSTDQGKNGEVE